MVIVSQAVDAIKRYPVKTKALLSIILFLISLLTFLLACPEWFFDGEDWGLILKGAQCSGIRDFFDYFIHGKVNNLAPIIATENPAALASMTSHDSFFTVYYRPMLLAIHAIQYYLFGLHAYTYFVCLTTMHATIAALLFYLLCLLVQPGIAFLCSLFFTFNPILYGWFGRIDTQQHLMNVLLMLVLCIMLKKCLEKWSLLYYLAACLFFLASLLTRETLLIFPAIILLWSFPLAQDKPLQHLKKLSNKRTLISGFCMAICLYFFMKSIAYPITLSMPSPFPSAISPTPITQLITAWARFFYDFFWLQWFPWPTYDFFKQEQLLWVYKLIKLLIGLCVTILFVTNTKKQLILLSVLTAFMLYWPPIIFATRGGLRLFYESLPFIMLALAILLNYSTSLHNRLMRYVIYGLFAILIGFNGYTVISGMHHMMIMPKKIDAALRNAQQSGMLADKPLLIVNMHKPDAAIGIIQAIQLYGINTTLPRYFFRNITVHTNNDPDLKKFIQVRHHEKSIRLISSNPEKVWFQTADFEEFLRPVVIHTLIHRTTTDNRVYDMSLNFDKDFYDPNVMIVVWLFKQEQFLSLESTMKGE